MAIHCALKVVYIAVSVTASGILAGVLCVIWTMPELPQTVIRDELCLPKSSLGGSLTCDKVEQRLRHYIRQMLEDLDKVQRQREGDRVRQEEDDYSVDLKNFLKATNPYRRPSARFAGKDVGEVVDDSPAMTPIRNWLCGSDNRDYGGFARYGVKFRDGRIVVPLTGLYIVYSLIDMYEPCNSTTGVPEIKLLNDTIRHSVYRFNVQDGVEEEIVSASVPHQKSKRFRYNYYSSYVSTVYPLVAGDELSLKTSNATYLNFSPEKNYFGVHLI